MNTRKQGNISKSLIITPVSTSDDYAILENNVIISEKHAARHDRDYVIQLAQNNNAGPVYYPVKFAADVPTNKLKLPLRLKMHFGYRNNSEYEIQLIEVNPDNIQRCANIAFSIQRMVPYIADRNYAINTNDFAKLILNRLRHYPVSIGQYLYFPYDKDNSIELRVESINDVSIQHGDTGLYQLDEKSVIGIELTKYCNHITLTGNEKHRSEIENIAPLEVKELPPLELILGDQNEAELPTGMLPKTFTLDFKSKGIGGHNKELEHLVRETFYSRALGNHFAQAYGVNHTKGILLYGPPGTGKTLIAREIGKLFSPNKVKVVNGAELKNQYVGQSTANLRKVFEDAIWDWNLHGKRSDIHVIIFDEIDVLCPKRGSRASGTGVDDDMVAQMLTILDGVDSPQNIIVIGLTNRKDLVDPAVLRPGRLGVHIEISLPDEQARLDILNIKTEAMQRNGLLDENVNLPQWAKATQNYTGAELEALVQNAAYIAMGANFDLAAGKSDLTVKGDIKEIPDLKHVANEHFKQAFAEITPAFGINQNNFNFHRENFITYDETMDIVINYFKSSAQTLFLNNDITRMQFLIAGSSGTGKTWLAKYLAETTNAKYIRVLSADRLLGLGLQQQINLIDEEFYNAAQSELSVIILDELEALLQADANKSTYNNALRIKFESLLKNTTETGNKCIVIATTRDSRFIEAMHLQTLFNETITVENVRLKQINSPAAVNTFKCLCQPLGIKVVPGKINNDNRQIDLPIRELIYKIRKFCSSNGNTKELNIDQFYEYIQNTTLKNLCALPGSLFKKPGTAMAQSNNGMMPSGESVKGPANIF